MINNVLLIWWIKILGKFIPDYAYTLIKRHLLAPTPTAAKWPKSAKRVVYHTKYGSVRTYTLGRGPTIWLVHGWADAYQYMPLVNKLVDNGYCCVAMEFLPSDKTQKRFVSLPCWTNVFDIATRHLEAPSHVLTYGVATTILGNSKWFSRYQGDLTLVSPTLDFYAGLERFFRRHTLPLKLLTCLVREAQDKENVHIKSLNVTSAIEQFDGRMSVFYSKSDDTSTVKFIRSLSDKENRKIVEFKGASTCKILRSRSLLASVQA